VGVDALLMASLALMAGGTFALSPGPAGAGFLLAALLLWRPLGARRVLGCAALFALGAWRASDRLDDYDRLRFAWRDAIGHPRRCAFEARVASSPVVAHGSVSFLADVSSAECEDVPLALFRARLYGGPSSLARGDVIRGVADFAGAQLFRNFGTADPRPSAARSGAVARSSSPARTMPGSVTSMGRRIPSACASSPSAPIAPRPCFITVGIVNERMVGISVPSL